MSTELTPIYIVNRNRLTTTRKMVEYLADVPGAMPIVIDNASTYIPLLQWYSEYRGQVILNGENLGPFAAWRMFRRPWWESTHYVVTDSDLDLSGIPKDLLEVLRVGLKRHPKKIKCGLSLETRGMPTPFIQSGVDGNEARMWKTKASEGYWNAPTDTTFAMYRAGFHCTSLKTKPAIRADRPYCAKHVPWYKPTDDEELYYNQHADPQWASTLQWINRE